MIWLVVGDAATQLERMKGLGFHNLCIIYSYTNTSLKENRSY